MLKISKTTPNRPPRMIIYGEHKIGKSTFASTMPSPVFIQTEDGLGQLGVDAFDKSNTFTDVLSALNQLMKEPHDFKTVVVDSLDWLERLIWTHICQINGWQQLGDGAYGAGYKLAINEWGKFINLIEQLNIERKMIVCFLAHAKITKFEDPERDNYDRYEIDLHEKASRLICEYVDIIGFAAEKVTTTESKEGFTKSVKAKGTGERVLNLNKKPAFEAGNRYGLPDKIGLTWQDMAKAFSEKQKNKE